MSATKIKTVTVKTAGPLAVKRNEPPALYLREEVATGERDGRTIECCLAVPRSCLVFDVTDSCGKAQYVVDIAELVEQIDALRAGFLERATAPAAEGSDDANG